MTLLKSVYLNYTSETNEHYCTEEGYKQVRELVMKLRICKPCERFFDQERPCVGLHICLSCFLAKHPKLTLLGAEKVNGDGETTYTFLHEDGKVYTSRENYSEKPSEDIAYTLRQYDFHPPQTYKPFRQDKEIRLYSSDFQIYGNLQTASVIVADYNDYYRKDHITFLLYKNGSFKELTRRGEGKVLFARAEAMLEKLKLPNGEYLIDGNIHSRIYDSDLYRVISKLESAMYDISLQFGLPAPQQAVTSPQEETSEEIEQSSPQVEEVQETEESANWRTKRKGRPRLTLVQPMESVPVESRVIGKIRPTEENGDDQIETEETTDPGNGDHM